MTAEKGAAFCSPTKPLTSACPLPLSVQLASSVQAASPAELLAVDMGPAASLNCQLASNGKISLVEVLSAWR